MQFGAAHIATITIIIHTAVTTTIIMKCKLINFVTIIDIIRNQVFFFKLRLVLKSNMQFEL